MTRKILLTVMMLMLLIGFLFPDRDLVARKGRTYLGCDFSIPLEWNYRGWLLLKYKDKLLLTPQQMQKIKESIIEDKEYSIRNAAEIKIKELRLAYSLKQAKVNRKEIERQIRSLGGNKVSQVIKYMNYLFNLRKVLTPKQRQSFNNISRENNPKKTKKVNRRIERLPIPDMHEYFF